MLDAAATRKAHAQEERKSLRQRHRTLSVELEQFFDRVARHGAACNAKRLQNCVACLMANHAIAPAQDR